MTRLLIDCDTGIDDTLAILTAVFDDNTELVGVGAVWGNIDVRQAARNSDYVLQLAGADEVPVALGAAGPLNGDDAVFAAHVHGADGLGGAAVLDHRPALSGRRRCSR